MRAGEKYLLIQKNGSQAGRIRLVASEKGLAAILWENDHPNRVRPGNIIENDSHPVLLKAEQELREYFDGKRKVFSLDLDFNGTEFQMKVRKALLTIPCGETRT